MIADSVAFVADRGRETVYDAEHFFDGYRSDRAYALSTLRAAREAGARTLVLCDTNGGTLTGELVVDRRRRPVLAGGGPGRAGASCGASTPTTTPSLPSRTRSRPSQAGVRHVQATINGYGERCGNANMVSILANLALKTTHELVPAGGGELAGLTELSRSVAEIANVAPHDYQPYVGRSAFAHKGGVHGAAVAKVERSYQHVDPTAVGNAGRLVVSELGGKANTAIRARQLGHELEGVVDPRELSELIKQLENEGLAFEGAEASFELLIRRQAADYVAPFRIVDYTCLVEQRDGPRAPRRGDRQGRGGRRGPPHRRRRERPGQRAGRGPAQGAPRVLSGARRRPPRATTRCASSTATPRPPPGPGSSSTRRTARDVVDDGQRHEHHRGLGRGPRPIRSSTRSGSPARSSGGATSATSRPRTAPGATRPLPPRHGPDPATPATASTGGDR